MERKALIKSKIAVLKKLQNEIKESIEKEILSTPPMEYVRDISISPKTAIVSISAIRENRGILTPNFYLQDVQNELMVLALKPYGSDFEKIKGKIENMLATRYVFSKSQTRVPLNKNSLAKLETILKEYFGEEGIV